MLPLGGPESCTKLQAQSLENERQARRFARQDAQLRRLSAQVSEEKALRSALEERLSALERTIQAMSGNRKLAQALDR